METKINKSRLEYVCGVLSFSSFHAVDNIGNLRGLCLLLKDDGLVQVSSSSANYIDAIVNMGQVGLWSFTSFYEFLKRARRCQSWDLILKLQGCFDERF